MFKLYLGRILGKNTDSGECYPLLLYHMELRALIGEVLMQPEELGPPGPYLPLFCQTTNTAAKLVEVRCEHNMQLYYLYLIIIA